MQQFGTYGFYLKDVVNTISPPNSDVSKEECLKLIEKGDTELNPDALMYGDNLIVHPQFTNPQLKALRPSEVKDNSLK